MEFHKLTGSQPRPMYVREVLKLTILAGNRYPGFWKWLWHKIFRKPLSLSYKWVIECRIEDNGFLLFSDVVEIHGIKHRVHYSQRDHGYMVLYSMDDTLFPITEEKFKNAQVQYVSSVHPV